jgi:cytidine deaminase
MLVSNDELVRRAKKVAKIHKGAEFVKIGEVGSALVTDKNNVYVGVSIDACCGIGFCGEHSAIASMVTNREYVIKKIVALTANGKIIPPCGRCREMMYEINEKNIDTDVIISKTKTVKLKELLPHIWQKSF